MDFFASNFLLAHMLVLSWLFRSVSAVGLAPTINLQERKYIEKVSSGRLELYEDLRLFVKYKNQKAMVFATIQGKEGNYDMSFPMQQTLSLRATNRTALVELLNYDQIEYIEPIHKISTLPIPGIDVPKELPTPSPAPFTYPITPTIDISKYDDTMMMGEGSLRQRQMAEKMGYGVTMVQAPDLWNISTSNVMTICVIDTGVGIDHPDLPSSNVNGTSMGSFPWDEDAYSHGTHCAGIIGAIGNNNQGIVGVFNDPTKFKLHIARAIDDQGNGDEADLLSALESCLESGAKVVSMSIGGDEGSETLRAAFESAYDQDVLLLSAAGNDGSTVYNYPSAYPHVMSVAAVNKKENVPVYSQRNDQVEIAGPGHSVKSTITTNNGTAFGYDHKSGTSMATPFVAGVAALVWSHFPACSNNQIRNVLLRTAYDSDGNGCSHKLGYGIVQAKAAYDLLYSDGCTAGDASPVPLSSGGVGGCFQDPNYTAPPTAAPTAFQCSEHNFTLELTTDHYGYETSWELTNNASQVVGSGSGYASSTTYSELLCVPPDEYTFTIMDFANDGICCLYGNGAYSAYYKGKLVAQGSEFGAQESATFGCVDDDEWIFTTFAGNNKTCTFVGKKPHKRCSKVGVDANGNNATGFEACPDSCDSCPNDPVL